MTWPEDTLDWASDARSLLEDLMVKGPPEVFREAATHGVHRESERLATVRESTRVETADVALACLGVSPPIFLPNISADLESRGFDAEALQAEAEALAKTRPARRRRRRDSPNRRLRGTGDSGRPRAAE